MSVESNFVIALVSHCYALLWAQKSRAFFQPIRSKTKTNDVLLARVYPRLAPAKCICLKLSLSAVIGQRNCYGFSFTALNWKLL